MGDFSTFPPPRKANRRRNQWEANEFHGHWSAGRFAVGSWARIDLNLHAAHGFVGIVVGYTEDFLVKLSDGQGMAQAMPRHLVELGPLEGARACADRLEGIQQAAQSRKMKRAWELMDELKGGTPAESIEIMALRIVELEGI